MGHLPHSFIIFLGVSFIFGWLVVGQDQIFRFSDAVKRSIGIDFLWLSAVILVVGTPTAFLLGVVAFYRIAFRPAIVEHDKYG